MHSIWLVVLAAYCSVKERWLGNRLRYRGSLAHKHLNSFHFRALFYYSQACSTARLNQHGVPIS